MGFTKGPWRTGKAYLGGPSRTISTESGVPICDTLPGKENNANLIAAAPDMYEALEWTCDKCGKDRSYRTVDECGECPVGRALAKADGR